MGSFARLLLSGTLTSSFARSAGHRAPGRGASGPLRAVPPPPAAQDCSREMCPVTAVCRLFQTARRGGCGGSWRTRQSRRQLGLASACLFWKPTQAASGWSAGHILPVWKEQPCASARSGCRGGKRARARLDLCIPYDVTLRQPTVF